VQLVEHQKPQSLSSPNQLTVFALGEEQLQHHVVRKEDVGRVGANCCPLQALFLPRVTREADRGLAFGIALLEKLGQLLVLAIRQRVHWINDNGLDALTGAPAEHVIHNRDDVGQALAVAGAAGQNVGLLLFGFSDTGSLVGVQRQSLSRQIRWRFVDAEDSRAFSV